MVDKGEKFAEIPLSERFGFGDNWSKFIADKFSEERIASSIEVFKKFTGLSTLKGRTFLDIGSGSGLHSLAALRLGADQILSFDFDPKAVETTSFLKKLSGEPTNWRVCQGSILDRNFLDGIEKHDFVYSWGVLHHTGDFWNALRNAVSLVASGGHFYIAVYSLDVQPKAEYWISIKKEYVSAGKIKRFLMEQSYFFRHVYQSNPILHIKGRLLKNDKRARGMDLLTDVRDWLGGWPMEFAFDKDVINFVEETGFKLIGLDQGKACTEFLFINLK
jgi:2-polyprenyl-3-methyl-5-hydroxy-6-metoxy-1,4-benzoquinol methylase